ncbi:GNAT family N-acetyltransferase [Piscinibacter sakaiensis]|uniref:GNAT family N-acetyltransferase n=1 Tax=Piscinibacter sakaiensis TaxID=1547922 RepID=UPI003AAE6C10
MADMLVSLYRLPAGAMPARGAAPQPTVRKPLGGEARLIVDWIAEQFGAAWASEAQTALGNRPVSLFIALDGGNLLGFACYDATARGFFGPIGLAPAARRQGLGARLLRACLDDMRTVGYGYAVIGGAGPQEFFKRSVGAVEIAGSAPGIYHDMLRAAKS